KISPAATMPVTLVMLEAIRDYFYETGIRIGMKPAGAIRTAKEALAYLVMVKETLGDDWLTPALFRFGASTLLNDVLMQLVKVVDRYQLFINGRFVAPKSGEYFDSINPATEEKLAEIGSANEKDVDLAVKAARRAYKNVWSKMRGRERGKYLFRIARLIQEKARELAVLETMDGGKTIKESRDIDLPLVAAHFFYYADWADKLEYAFPVRNAQPLGVAGQIIPWNFPL